MLCKRIKANIEKFVMINSMCAYNVVAFDSDIFNWLITKNYSCCKQSNETDSLLDHLLLKSIPRLNGECQELNVLCVCPQQMEIISFKLFVVSDIKKQLTCLNNLSLLECLIWPRHYLFFKPTYSITQTQNLVIPVMCYFDSNT